MAWPGKLTLTDKAIYFEVFYDSMRCLYSILFHRLWDFPYSNSISRPKDFSM